MARTVPAGSAAVTSKPILLAAWGWSAALFVIATGAVILSSWGATALFVAAIPLLLCAVVNLLLLPQSGPAIRVGACAGIAISALVALAALVSFIAPALAVVPTCALLIAASVLKLS